MGRKIFIGICLIALLMGLAGYFTRGLFSPKVGLCLDSGAVLEDSAGESLQDKLVLAGYTVLTRNAESSAETQLQQVQELLQEDVDVILLFPTAHTSLPDVLHLTMETPVVVLGQEPENLGNAYYVGSDKTAPGRVMAQQLSSIFNKVDVHGDGEVDYIVLAGPQGQAADTFEAQITKSLSDRNTKKLETTYCENSALSAKELCMQAFSKFGRDLELIFCSSEALALGAIDAIESSGRTPGEDVLVMGVGDSEELLTAFRQKKLSVLITEDTDAIIKQTMQVVKKLANHATASQINYVNHNALINKS